MATPRKTWPATVFIRLGPGSRTEEPISNEEFFTSLHSTGCWLRVIAAHPHCGLAASAEPGSLQSLGSAAAVYQSCALAVEDSVAVLATLVALASRPDLSAANVIATVFLGGSEGKQDLDTIRKGLVAAVERRKPYRLNAEAFLLALAAVKKVDLPLTLGIPWKANHYPPWVDARDRPEWKQLPNLLSGMIADFFTQPHIQSILRAHNKLKHGPQAVVMPLESALSRRGITSSVEGVFGGPRLRLLFDSARTECEPNSLGAPFLSHESHSLSALFYGSVLSMACHLNSLARWWEAAQCSRSVPLTIDEPVSSVLRESLALGFGSTSLTTRK